MIYQIPKIVPVKLLSHVKGKKGSGHIVNTLCFYKSELSMIFYGPVCRYVTGITIRPVSCFDTLQSVLEQLTSLVLNWNECYGTRPFSICNRR